MFFYQIVAFVMTRLVSSETQELFETIDRCPVFDNNAVFNLRQDITLINYKH